MTSKLGHWSVFMSLYHRKLLELEIQCCARTPDPKRPCSVLVGGRVRDRQATHSRPAPACEAKPILLRDTLAYTSITSFDSLPTPTMLVSLSW